MNALKGDTNLQLYHPVGVWSGRLIFNREDRLENGAVWMEIHNSPVERLRGRIVELGYDTDRSDIVDETTMKTKYNPNLYGSQEMREYIDFLTTDITFEQEAIKSVQSAGRIHPVRCNGLKNVSPLETLAGARPTNDMQVLLDADSVRVIDKPTPRYTVDHQQLPATYELGVALRIRAPPIQVRGQQRCLVKFLGPVHSSTTMTTTTTPATTTTTHATQSYAKQGNTAMDTEAESAEDGESSSNGGEDSQPKQKLSYFQYRIRHWNMETQAFDEDSAIETVLIPKFPVNNRGLHVATPVGIEESPLNQDGWYLYGHFESGQDGMVTDQNFIVEAWEPRQALKVEQLTNTVRGIDACKHALRNKIWKNARYQKGTVATHLLDPQTPAVGSPTTASNEETRSSDWKEGDDYLVIHIFGGIGGNIVNEENFLGLIPGHFAFGNATIVRDDFADELQFRIVHRQVYAHNNGGIIAGPNLWSSYCGDLERGWFGTRPISDIIIKLDCISHTYHFGEGVTPICPLHEALRELNEMGARYRSGDGDGSALVSSAHSCVQDSSQALYAALQECYRKFTENPKVRKWRKNHPNDTQEKDIRKLAALYRDLTHFLTPFGVRKDWSNSAKAIKGTEKQTVVATLVETIRSYGTVVPRRAHDKLAKIFLHHGAELRFIRTNQIGGNDKNIYPLAPARAFHYSDNRKDPEQNPNATNTCCCCF